MAMPIKETPVLKGKSAIAFITNAERNLVQKKTAAQIKERKRCLDIYEKCKQKHLNR